MDRDHFMSYVACFNARNFDGLRSYWASDVELELPPDRQGNRRILSGPDAIVASYEKLSSYVRERLEVDFLIIADGHVACEMGTTFEAFEDHPD
ncbi:nuclear transport factor 2 family protein, partial [Sphingomonas sp. ZT3P38]|uniref:nuclear transport factor 2 family protein n=1 Tax=Parasphingomonas zepuensis TaxID=3096161 RepID=UPI002FC74BF5